MDSKILQHSSIFYKLEKSFNQNFKTLTVSCMNKPVETLIDKQVIVIVDKALSSDSQFQFLILCLYIHQGQDSWHITLHKGVCRIISIIGSNLENETGSILGSWGNTEQYSSYKEITPTSAVSPASRWKHSKRRSSSKKKLRSSPSFFLPYLFQVFLQ